MNYTSLTEQAHQIARQHLIAGSHAIDCTVGNGHDLLFLAQHVGDSGLVFGYDIQKSALEKTTAKLAEAQLSQRVQLNNFCHSKFLASIDESDHGKFDVIMFNLGYMPGSDKSLVTLPATTLAALRASLSVLSASGVITIVAYPGHPVGSIETDQVENFCSSLNPEKYTVEKIKGTGNPMKSPVLYTIYSIL